MNQAYLDVFRNVSAVLVGAVGLCGVLIILSFALSKAVDEWAKWYQVRPVICEFARHQAEFMKWKATQANQPDESEPDGGAT